MSADHSGFSIKRTLHVNIMRQGSLGLLIKGFMEVQACQQRIHHSNLIFVQGTMIRIQ